MLASMTADASSSLELRRSELLPSPTASAAGEFALRAWLEPADEASPLLPGRWRLSSTLTPDGGGMCMPDVIFADGFQPL